MTYYCIDKYLAFPGRTNTDLTLQVRLVRSQPGSAEFLQTFKKAHQVYQRYQITIHGDSADKCNESQFKRFLCNSPLEVVLTCDLALAVKGRIAHHEHVWSMEYYEVLLH